MNSHNDYEQLKRRNRRRLVGAMVMVIIAGVVLLLVMNRQSSKPMPVPDVDVISTNAASAGLNASATSTASHSAQTASEVLVDIPAAASVASQASANSIIVSAERLPSSQVKAVEVKPDVVKPTTPPEPKSVSSTPVMPDVHTTKQAPVVPAYTGHQPVITPALTPTVTTATESNHNTVTKTKTETKNKPVTDKSMPANAVKKTETKSTSVPEPTKTPIATPKSQPVKSLPPKSTATTKDGALTPQQILDNNAAGKRNDVVTATATTKLSSTRPTNNNHQGNKAKLLIQIGAFTTETQAKAVQQKLASVGVAVYILPSQTSRGTLYRVRTGSYSDRTEAQQQLNKIHAAGVDGLMMTQ